MLNIADYKNAEVDVVLEYVVLNNKTLGYLFNDGYNLYVGILSSKIGGPDCFNGPVLIGENDKIRVATLADFKSFRVSPKGYDIKN